MKDTVDLLFNEFTALLEALRRDLRVQVAQSIGSDRDVSCLGKARDDIRLLEALNPKRRQRHLLPYRQEKPAFTLIRVIKKQS